MSDRGITAAYVGILTPGSTSRMRAECLRQLTPGWSWDWVDTDPPLESKSRLWRSLGYRYQIGRAVDDINTAVMSQLRSPRDLIWVDKAVFLRPETVRHIRRAACRLVHYTPDTAFHANRSRHFDKSIAAFDLLVTTKSFEIAEYRKRVPDDRMHLTTQGFDPSVHFPRRSHDGRAREVAFVGLAEPDRERCIAALLERNIPVRLAGQGWARFLKRWGRHPKLNFAGTSLFGGNYAELLSRSWIGLGLLSKRFPELHTTRTFEVPACGAVLATEATLETRRFFDSSEVIFFDDHAELATRIQKLFSDADNSELLDVAVRGMRRVTLDGRDYPSILRRILDDDRIAVSS